MTTREIVTLQLGHYANFVGTHMWNLQSSAYSNTDKVASSTASKEINFDVTFREGRTLAGEVTYTPRAIFFDLKGSLNTLKQDGVLYDLPAPVNGPQWTTNTTMHEFSKAQKNEFLLHLESDEIEMAEDEECSKITPTSKKFVLDSVVNVWSDYLKPHLHRKTVSILDDYNHADADSFSLFSLGAEEYKKKVAEVEDRIHFFTEECDNLQGFHLLVDAYNGFGGFGGKLYEDYIEEEFNNKSCFVIETLPASLKRDAQKFSISIFNIFMSMDAFSNSSGILPLSTMANMLYTPTKNESVNFPFLIYEPSLPYHTSAILASAIDNLTLPYRLVDHVSHLNSHISALTSGGRKVLGLKLSMPFVNEEEIPMFDLLQNRSKYETGFPEFCSMTPGLHSTGKVSCQNATISGLTEEQMFGSRTSVARPRYSSAKEMVQAYLYREVKTSMSNVHLIKTLTHIREPYPHIFLSELDYSTSSDWSNSSNLLDPVPIATLLQNNGGVSGHLKEILERVEKIPKNRLECYLGGDLEWDDFKEKLDRFKSLIDNYEDVQSDTI